MDSHLFSPRKRDCVAIVISRRSREIFSSYAAENTRSLAALGMTNLRRFRIATQSQNAGMKEWRLWLNAFLGCGSAALDHRGYPTGHEWQDPESRLVKGARASFALWRQV